MPKGTAARLAFYVAEHGNIVDKAIAWYTNSKYSHVELVCCDGWYSTSPRDMKIRKKNIIPKEGHWEYLDVQVDPIYIDKFYDRTEGCSYDWLGILFSQFIPLSVHNVNRWFCSEWCATALKIVNANHYSPEDLYQYIKEKNASTD